MDSKHDRDEVSESETERSSSDVDDAPEIESDVKMDPAAEKAMTPGELLDSVITEGTRRGITMRITTAEDGTKLVAAYDAISVICGCNLDEARKKFERILSNEPEFEKADLNPVRLKKADLNSVPPKKELWSEIKKVQFPGPRQRETPAITGLQFIYVTQALPSNKYSLVDKFKAMCNQISVRYLGGDRSIAREVEAIDDAFTSGAIPANHPLQVFRDEKQADRPPPPTEEDRAVEEATRAIAAIDISAQERASQARLLFEAKMRRDEEAHRLRMQHEEKSMLREEAEHQERLRREEAEHQERLRKGIVVDCSGAFLHALQVTMAMTASIVPTDDRGRIAKSSEEANLASMAHRHCEMISTYMNRAIDIPAPVIRPAIEAPPAQLAIEAPAQPAPPAQLAIEAPPQAEQPAQPVPVPPPMPRIQPETDYIRVGTANGFPAAWLKQYASLIGKKVKAEYIRVRQRNPPLHAQLIGGRSCQVCTYYADDGDIILAGIRAQAALTPPAPPAAPAAPARQPRLPHPPRVAAKPQAKK